MGEIMVILVVALLVLGPTKLPEAAKQIGKAIRELRKHTDSLRETIETDEQLSGTVRELRSALRGDIMNTVMPPTARPAAPEEPREDAPGGSAAAPAAAPEAVPDPHPVPVPDPHPAPAPAAVATAAPAPAAHPRPEGAVAQGESDPEGGRTHG
ncbi:MAG TPA: twin-arginine translocase TatA/TatE family subunit [Haliangiales bacterium]|nr:twin-arginine translocase TatA/TatE family subunit [Haliangiales bacterium]